jgi:hypothetical protein
MLPDLATTIVITTLLSGAAIALADRRRGLWFIFGVLGLNQLVLHLFLELAGSHEHAMSHGQFDDLTMLAGHSGAALLTALMLARAESALFMIASALSLILPRKPTPLPVMTSPHPVCISEEPVCPRAQWTRWLVDAPRGPPRSPVKQRDSAGELR